MVAGKEFSWEEVSSLDFENPARQAWRAAVAEVAEKAKATLPECNGRVDSAVKIVLAGDVELLPDGKAKVASQSNGTTTYFVVNGTCECRDFAKAPSNWCKHKIATGIHKRALALAKPKLEATAPAPAAPQGPAESAAAAKDGRLTLDLDPEVCAMALPEAPASVNVYVEISGRKVQVTLRDTDETRLLARLDALLQRFPVEEATAGAPPEGWCTTHGVQMTQHHNAKGSWWSHKLADGTWCRGK